MSSHFFRNRRCPAQITVKTRSTIDFVLATNRAPAVQHHPNPIPKQCHKREEQLRPNTTQEVPPGERRAAKTIVPLRQE